MKMPNQMRVLESLCGNQPHKKPAMYITMLVIMKWMIVILIEGIWLKSNILNKIIFSKK